MLPGPEPPHTTLRADSFLEYAFLRWVLAPATREAIIARVQPQREVSVDGRRYRLDYEIAGDELLVTVELDGYAFHSSREAFTRDRLRQNDLHATGRIVVRFSYDAIRNDTARCVSQLKAVLGRDPSLAALLVDKPHIEVPEMDPDPSQALAPPPRRILPVDSPCSFDETRARLNRTTLRDCQTEALSALAEYYTSGGLRAACVMSVGAGKTALGVAAALSFTRRRALVVTPGSVIRGTFDRAFDHRAVGNALYGLPGGPLIPGCPPPRVRTLDRNDGAIRDVTRDDLMACEVIVTNFHSLGNGEQPDHLLAKLEPDDIDLIVVDEAHIAAAESYQRLFRRFPSARKLLMSACFQRLDGQPIDADVVYRYSLDHAIADGNAKQLRLHRYAAETTGTTYEIVHADGRREEIVGRDAVLSLLGDERRLASVTARSLEPMRNVMRRVRHAVDRQSELLYPVKPRVLFSALGERHAEQIARVAVEFGIPAAHIHHSMTDKRIREIRGRFESDSGDLQGLVHLRMLGQGYDFPAITVVVPMRPYGSFSECYQFIGRGIRVIHHPALDGRVAPGEQILDIVYHAEFGIDEHMRTLLVENGMDPETAYAGTESQPPVDRGEPPEVVGRESVERTVVSVLSEQGAVEQRVVHDAERIDRARIERERTALAHRYADYVKTSDNPAPFEQYIAIMDQLAS